MKHFTCSVIAAIVFLSAISVSAQNIGMNTTSPLWPVHIKQTAGTTLSDNQPLLFAEYTGINTANAIAIQGRSKPSADFGIGGDFEGGFIGAQGKVTGTGEANYYGLFGTSGGAGNGYHHGVFGFANGLGTNVGLLGMATGGTTNWAGFFGLGNVHVQNKLAIGTTDPLAPLHVKQNNTTLLQGGSIATIEYTGPSTPMILNAVTGRCVSAPGAGTGSYFEGGNTGARGVVYGNGNLQYWGVSGYAAGTGNGSFNGVYGLANGAGYNIGIWGEAFGGATNWAGFFGSGNVYIQNKLGLGTDAPSRQLHVMQGTMVYQNYQPIAMVEYNGPSVQKQIIGLQVDNQPAPGFGIGMDVDANTVGLDVHTAGGGAESTGVYAFASGSTQFGNKGVYAQVTDGPGLNVALYGRAPLGENSFSGFFEEGNVFVERNLGIGEQDPEHNLEIKDERAFARLTTTGAGFGSAFVLKNITPGAGVLGTIFFTDATNHSKASIFYESDHHLNMVVNNEVRLRINQHGNVGIGRDPSTNRLEIEGNASKSSAGDWLANSDARLKKNMESLDPKETIEKLLALKGITYEWNDDKTGTARPEGTQYGFTAQNIQGVFPELVEEDANGYLQTAYSTYDAMIIESLRYLYEENKALRALLEQQTK